MNNDSAQGAFASFALPIAPDTLYWRLGEAMGYWSLELLKWQANTWDHEWSQTELVAYLLAQAFGELPVHARGPTDAAEEDGESDSDEDLLIATEMWPAHVDDNSTADAHEAAANQPPVFDDEVYDDEEEDLTTLVMDSRTAVAVGVDPWLQLEIGCVIASRVGLEQPQICPRDGVAAFQLPTTRRLLHDSVAHGSVEQLFGDDDREPMIKLAMEAFSHALSYYRRIVGEFFAFLRMSAEDSPMAMGPLSHELSYSIARVLLSADGLRTCATELWMLSVADWATTAIESVGTDLMTWKIPPDSMGPLLLTTSNRAAETRGRLSPMLQGRRQAIERLAQDFDWWDLAPQGVRDYIADAEYAYSLLQDPTFKRKPIVASFCMSVEELLQRRLGDPIDAYLRAADEEDAERFKRKFLRSQKGDEWQTATLTMGQFLNNIEKEAFQVALRRVLSPADFSYATERLPADLDLILAYRNAASHAGNRTGSDDLFTDEGINALRRKILGRQEPGIIEVLSRVRPILSTS